MAGLRLREGQELEAVEVVQAFGKNASWSPPSGAVLGNFNWEETPGQTQS